MAMPEAGDHFQQKYEIVEVLGKGGFATVYRARDLEIGREVAIKILRPVADEDADEYSDQIAQRFTREARVIAGLQDQHTITMFEFGTTDSGLRYMVFEYVRGVDLAALRALRGAQRWDVALHVVRQVLLALNEAHTAGVLHRDIKPSNVLVFDYGGDPYSVKLLDFGIAKPMAEKGAAGLTRAGALIGTPRYMAPEQIFGDELTPASDLYALGLVAYELLVGRPALDGEGNKDILRAAVSTDPHRLPEEVAPAPIRAAVERMLAREALRRPQSAAEAIAEIDAAIAASRMPSAPIAAPPPPAPALARAPAPAPAEVHVEGTTESTVPPGERRTIAAIALVVVVVAVAGGFAMKRLRRPQTTVPVVVAPTPPPPPRPEPLADPHDAAPPAALAVDSGPDLVADASQEVLPRGCGRELPPGEFVKVDVTAGRANREASIYVPRRYDPNVALPLIIAFSYRTDSSEDYVKHAHLVGAAESHGFVLVGLEPANRFEPWHDAADADFARALPWAVADVACIDLTRIYAVGHDEGGHFARELACVMPLSGVAVTGDAEVRGAPTCVPGRRTPLLRIYGARDQQVPKQGGVGCHGADYLSAAKTDALLSSRNECTGKPRRWLKTADGNCDLWGDCAAPYASCEMRGGHILRESRWDLIEPVKCNAPILRPASTGEAIGKFFVEHGVPL